ncbi:MAG: HPF/RaiA family ribosome-associated protein [Dehalococcoidia bacterium]|nr:HPF/RaiA family ribosome-associated protein [Dehalococcoidia bacterium]
MTKKLQRVVGILPNLRSVVVEITFEHTRPAAKRYVVQATLAANGTLLRVEDRGEDVHATVDKVHDLLERRIRDWKGHVYVKGRSRTAARKAAEQEGELTRMPPEDQTGRIVRQKSHDIKPLAAEDAVTEMELLGHDFYFFLNAATEQYNVLYRRKAGGYGLIGPSLT